MVVWVCNAPGKHGIGVICSTHDRGSNERIMSDLLPSWCSFGDPRRGLPTPSLLPGVSCPAPGAQPNPTHAAQAQQPTPQGQKDTNQHAHQQQQQQEPEAPGAPFELDLVKRQGSTFTSPAQGAGLRGLHLTTAATAHTAASAATTTTTVTGAHADAAPGSGGSTAAGGAAPLYSQEWDGWRDVVLRVGATAANTCVIMSIQARAEGRGLHTATASCPAHTHCRSSCSRSW